MIAGGGSTTDYWELDKQAKWLGTRGEQQKTRPKYEKAIHTSPWRFYPGQPKGTIAETVSGEGTKSIVEEYIERKQRRKRPRTLRPIPFPARSNTSSMAMMMQQQQMLQQQQQRTLTAIGEKQSTFQGGIGTGIPEPSDVYGLLQQTYISPTSDSQSVVGFAQQQKAQRWADHQATVDDAVTSQLRRYKAENRALRKQKRATLYILRLLEQKILNLSGSSTVVEPADPSAPGYEMHPEVYSILKSPNSAAVTGAKKQEDSNDSSFGPVPTGEVEQTKKEAIPGNGSRKIKKKMKVISVKTPEMIENDISVATPAADTEAAEEKKTAEDNGAGQEEERDLVRAQKKLLHDIFTALDTDKSGHLNKREFRRAILRRPDLGQFVNMRTFHKSFEKFDANADGFVTFHEFQEYCLSKQAISSEVLDKARRSSNNTTEARLELKKIFDSIDVYSKGFLEKNDFRKAILTNARLGRFFSVQTFLGTFAIMNSSDNRVVTQSEFEKFCLTRTAKATNRNQDEDKNQLSSIFKNINTNGSGVLVKREFRQAIQRQPDLGSFFCPQGFLKALNSLESRAQGKINVDEFTEFCLASKYGTPKP